MSAVSDQDGRKRIPIPSLGDSAHFLLAQGSYAVQLCLTAVCVLPNFARSCHHSQIPGGTEQFLFSTHKALKIKVVSLFVQRYITFSRKPNLWRYFFSAVVSLVVEEIYCLLFSLYHRIKPVIVKVTFLVHKL